MWGRGGLAVSRLWRIGGRSEAEGPQPDRHTVEVVPPDLHVRDPPVGEAAGDLLELLLEGLEVADDVMDTGAVLGEPLGEHVDGEVVVFYPLHQERRRRIAEAQWRLSMKF